ncbi:dipeptidase E-like protein [Leptotrombidium deliense]|uniref:Dipeptidase E-like protein n=1 Tax=Leptotrombidium deliense TaxID=299467 RepID=A0A443SNU5_9ACAR|nr:dipeptidase E-like protein [Leptotrombidium deliense]
MTVKLLLLSNSSAKTSSYLHIWKATIKDFVKGVNRILFIPFAGVRLNWNDYTQKVKDALDMEVENIANFDNMVEAVNNAEAICIGGGNTFNLLLHLQKYELIEPIRKRVLSGIPYIGWSAGANVATVDIKTTNDMPIVWPSSCAALGLVPYNVNPHFTDLHPENVGESRIERLDEFALLNSRPIVALSNGTAICVNGNNHYLIKSELVSDVQCKIWLPDNECEGKRRIIDIPMQTDIRPIIEQVLKV